MVGLKLALKSSAVLTSQATPGVPVMSLPLRPLPVASAWGHQGRRYRARALGRALPRARLMAWGLGCHAADQLFPARPGMYPARIAPGGHGTRQRLPT